MSIIMLILGLAIGFIAGRGLWRGTLARFGAWATAASTSSHLPRLAPVHDNARERQD